MPFQAIAKAIIGGEYEGFAKIIGNKETEDTLGIHIIGPHATDLIAEASLAFYLDATPWEIGPRPTRTRRSRRSSARPRWRSTAGRSTSSRTRGRRRRSGDRSTEDAMTVTDRSGDAATSPLAASVGLTDADLVAMYRTVALARAVDERMWILNRAGRIPFVISGQGHEGAQVGLTWPLQKSHDWIAPFYRSIATCLAFGMSARDIMTAQYATASDPSSGGRQMPGHYGYAGAPPGLGVVAGRDPDPARGRDRAGGEDPARRARSRSRSMGEGSSNQGDVHEALNFAAIHKLPFVFMVENNGYAICVPAEKELSVKDVAVRASGYGMPGVVVDGTDVLACYAAAQEAVDLARAGGGPTPDRGQGHPAHRALLGRPADEVPVGRRPRGGQGPRPAADLPGGAAGRRAC